MTAEDYLTTQGMSNVGHYGLLIRDTSKQKMHQIMEDFAKKKNALNDKLALGLISKLRQELEKCRLKGVNDGRVMDAVVTLNKIDNLVIKKN